MSNVWTGEGPTRRRRSDRLQISLVIGILLLLEFYLRPSLVEGRGMPDFLLLTLLILCLRLSPGWAAVTGLLVGATIDVLTPARFGANMLVHTLIGYASAWGRAVFFADHVVVAAGLFFAGTWIRNLLVLLLSGARAVHAAEQPHRQRQVDRRVDEDQPGARVERGAAADHRPAPDPA